MTGRPNARPDKVSRLPGTALPVKLTPFVMPTQFVMVIVLVVKPIDPSGKFVTLVTINVSGVQSSARDSPYVPMTLPLTSNAHLPFRMDSSPNRLVNVVLEPVEPSSLRLSEPPRTPVSCEEDNDTLFGTIIS